MADETKDVGQTTKDVGGFDPAKLQEMVQGAVRSSIENMVREGQAKQAELDATAATEKAAREAASKTDALGDIFKPALEPALAAARNAETRAMMAQDVADFYGPVDTTNPTAVREQSLRYKFKEKIEGVVAAQMKRGNLISRKDAWNWLRGGELYEDLTKETLTSHERKLQEAREAAAAGPSVSIPKFAKPIEDLKTEELGEALKGVTF